MKPFGVRLAAGAITILLGALAAAQAQKDRSDRHESDWNLAAAAAPGQLPAPIVGVDAETSVDSETTDPAAGPTPLLAGMPEGPLGKVDGSFDEAAPIRQPAASDIAANYGGVAQVQYTEPTNGPANSMPLPDSLGASADAGPAFDAPAFDASSLDAPSFDAAALQTPEAGAADEPMATPNNQGWGLPAAVMGINESAPADTAMPNDAVMSMDVPTPDADTRGPEASGDAAATMGLPTSASMMASAEESPSFANPSSASEEPSNMLRGDNSLRGDASAMAYDGGAAMPAQSGAEDKQAASAELGPQDDYGQPGFAAQTMSPAAASTPQPSGSFDAAAQANAGPAGSLTGNEPSVASAPSASNGAAAPYGAAGSYGPTDTYGAADNYGSSMNNVPAGNNEPAGNYEPAANDGPAANYGPADNYGPAPNDTAAGNYGPAGNSAAADAMPAPQSYPSATPSYNNDGNLGNERIASRTLQPGMVNQAAPAPAPQQFDAPIAAQPVRVNPAETLASPGDRRLEGIQSPSIVIQKRAPSEVKVGKPASFVIHVQNVGSVEALDVQVHDRVPQGMRMIDASPAPQQQGEILVWELGAMPAGDERTVTMQLVPEQEGELGSVARVTFEAAASVRTMSTRPELKVVQHAPEQVLIGQQLEIEVEVSNPGTGAATGVVVQEDVPDGLEHPKGKQLDNLLGELAPGETRHQVLRMRAVAPGMIQNTIRLVADDGLTTEHTVDVEVIAPEIQVALAGPARRFLERPATYQLEIVNNGTADATHVEIKAQLDRGFTFVSTDFEGQYDPSQHAVSWYLESLPKGGRGKVPLTLLPVEEGNRKIVLDARADLGVIAKSESSVVVESLAEMTFQITDSADPIEVGGESIYEIRVKNSGSRDDSNVRVQLQLPPGIERIASDGEAQEDGRGGIFFAPKPLLAANSELVYRVRVRGAAEGTHIVKAIVTSDQSAVPVTKEESTMVYSDR
ncbi:hypothetical protein [Novipirellula caenicola]|uniref:DUF11 domain-containing protein n=1 Tax=Novipirellula caenicola TaxID=1536901 RepID=A0ABP9VUK2_9BACT